jgi:hypothetical protein
MSTGLTPLILDFLEWVAAGPHPYAEVMDRWRTSCPRLTVWEDAVDQGLVTINERQDTLMVTTTAQGLRLLADSGRLMARPAAE